MCTLRLPAPRPLPRFLHALNTLSSPVSSRSATVAKEPAGSSKERRHENDDGGRGAEATRGPPLSSSQVTGPVGNCKRRRYAPLHAFPAHGNGTEEEGNEVDVIDDRDEAADTAPAADGDGAKRKAGDG